MKQITLTGLYLRNFQGAREVQIPLTQNTSIRGANATGKTTLFNAYTWLLFGKNSLDRADFNVKTLDEKNQVIPGLEHEVEGTFYVDDVPIVLKRSMKEKHVKIRGTEETRLEHDYTFFFNGTPVSATEYRNRVNEMITEDVSKVITDPLYFNLRMKWQDRRAILSQLAGQVSDTDVLASVKAKQRDILNDLLTSGKALADHKKEMSTRRQKIKSELDQIPSRIDEVNRSIPAPMAWDEIDQAIDDKKTAVCVIEVQMEDASAAQSERFEEVRQMQGQKFAKEQALQAEINRIRSESSQVISEKQSQRDDLASKLRRAEESIARNQSDIAGYRAEITQLTEKNDRIREDWHKVNAEQLTIDETSFNCPACDRPLPAEVIEEKRSTFLHKFNEDKSRRLKSLNDEGTRNKERIAELETRISGMAYSASDDIELWREELKEIDNEISGLRSAELPVSDLQQQLTEEIQAFQIPEVAPADLSELKEKKAQLEAEIADLSSRLLTRDQIEKGNARIEELKELERNYSQQIADIERSEIAIDSFNRSKVEMIEARINGKFQMVKFKMFERQLNGGETEICECMVDGVPFSDLNTAMKINAGLDVINALTDFYGVSAPIWIDGRESVTELIETKSQLINLIVDPSAANLAVS